MAFKLSSTCNAQVFVCSHHLRNNGGANCLSVSSTSLPLPRRLATPEPSLRTHSRPLFASSKRPYLPLNAPLSAAVRSGGALKASSKLEEGLGGSHDGVQTTLLHRLPSGLRLEVITQKAQTQSGTLPPFVLIHGSYHAAWCWAEHWLPYLSALGHDCYSISLLGQGGSDVPDAKVAGTVQTHATNVAHFIRASLSTPPILVGHSFGGCVVQAYLADLGVDFPGADVAHHPSLAAAVLACSVPPTGNSKMVQRFLRTRPFMDTVKITWSLAAKGFVKNTSLCRESFFSPAMPDADVQRYQTLLGQSSRLPLFDLKLLNASLPVAKPPPGGPPVLVIGAENDYLVDDAGLQETGAFYDTPALTIPSMAHDIMLDVEWQRAADFVIHRLQSVNVLPKTTPVAAIPSS